MQGERRRLVTAIVTVLIVVALGLSDWPIGTLQAFWTDHAMLTNLLSGMIFVGIGLTVVEQWLARREEIRLRLVTSVAYSSVARATQGQARMMWFAAYGGVFINDLDFNIAESGRDRIRSVIRRLKLEEVNENDARSGIVVAPQVLADRMLQLLADDEWLGLCYNILRGALQSCRIVIARWMPLLASTKQSSYLLAELAAQADELGRLVNLLVRAVRYGDDLDEDHKRFQVAWRPSFSNAVVLTEGLSALRGHGKGLTWTPSSYRNLLTDEDRRYLSSLERNGRLGIMRPFE
jgi:hypothetical protein